MKVNGVVVMIVPILVVLTGCIGAPPAAEAPTAEPTPVFKPVVNVNDIMVSVVDHNSHILWNVANPKHAPKNDADWHVLEHAAVTLAASGGMISMGGSGPEDAKWAKDPEWQKQAQDMTNWALKAKLAVDSKNKEALVMAGDQLVVTCEACHAKFKRSIPAHVATEQQQPEHFGHD